MKNVKRNTTAIKRTNAHRRPKAERDGRALPRAKRILRAHLPELRQRYHIKSLGLFGSYVRGEQKKRSDLDVLVEFEVAPSLFTYVEIENYLSDLIGIKVDLVMKSVLKPAIGQRILAEVVPV